MRLLKNLFKCQHPHAFLVVEKYHTIRQVKEGDAKIITYYFRCIGCNAILQIKFADFRGEI